jgi:hypothetical protein
MAATHLTSSALFPSPGFEARRMLLQQKAEIARCQSEDCVLPADFDIHLSVFGKINEQFTTASYFAVTLRAF